MDEDSKKPSRWEAWKNFCIGVGALSALLLGAWANLKGEPVAEKTWTTLRDQVNKQTELLNRLHSRVIFLQAHEEGRTAASLQAKVDSLQKELDALRQSTPPPGGVGKPAPAPASQPKACAQGFVEDVHGRCRQVTKGIADRLNKEQRRGDAATVALAIERRKRQEAEQRKLELQRKLLEGVKSKVEPTLKSLPAKLEDAKD